MKHYLQAFKNSLLLVILLLISSFFYLIINNKLVHQTLITKIETLQERLNRVSPSLPPSKQGGEQTVSDGCDWVAMRLLAKNAVVQIFAYAVEFNLIEPYRAPQQRQCRGSAFFISEQGELITNAHVVNQAKAVFIQLPAQGKKQFEVEVIGISMERDLALLKIKPSALAELQKLVGTIPKLLLADSDLIRGSEEIMTLGFPLGQQALKGTSGIVSGRERLEGQNMIQISAPINPGSSGGPSINRCGQVIGVNTAVITGAQNVNYIIPSNEVKLFKEQIERMQQDPLLTTPSQSSVLLARKGSLGFIYGPASDELALFLGNPVPSGIYVIDVSPHSLTGEAGLKAGDMIYAINGHDIDLYGELYDDWNVEKVGIVDLISRMHYGEKMELVIYRNGIRHDLQFDFIPTKLPPIRTIFPGYEKIDYEIVGGMVLMQLSMNLLQFIAPLCTSLMWYSDPRNQMEPALIVTHLIPDTVISRANVFGPGTIITEVNGVKVGTLDEFRGATKASIETGILRVKTREGFLAIFPFGTIVQEEEKASQNFCYQTTEYMQDVRKLWQKKMKLMDPNQITDTRDSSNPLPSEKNKSRETEKQSAP